MIRLSGCALARALSIAAAAAVVSGCAGPQEAPSSTAAAPKAQPVSQPKSAARYNLVGYSPAFRQGYGDACESHKRSEARYKSDTDYAMGWNDGRAICGKR